MAAPALRDLMIAHAVAPEAPPGDSVTHQTKYRMRLLARLQGRLAFRIGHMGDIHA